MIRTKVVCDMCNENIPMGGICKIGAKIVCPNCRDKVYEGTRKENEKNEELNIPKESAPKQYKNKYVGTFKAIATINLVCSIIVALVVWIQFGSIEVPDAYSYYGTYSETNPIGVAVGFSVLIQGIIFYAFALLACAVAEDVAEIKNTVA